MVIIVVYLDYASTTPVSYEAMDVYTKIAKEYFCLPYGNNKLEEKSKDYLKRIKKTIADSFNVMDSELEFTSGAIEANNLALIGTMLANHKEGNHLIVSKLEHKSVYKICNYLEKLGFEIDYVDNDTDGLIDFENLRSLIRKDTVLVSICALNSETGVRQPLKMIRQIIKKENQSTLLHSDMASAVGKIAINLHDVDLASISSHKIFGPKGIGLLYRSEKVKITPLMVGDDKALSPCTNSVAQIAAFSVALSQAINDLEKKEHFVSRLNDKITTELKDLDNITFNKTNYCVPYILSITLKKMDASLFLKRLNEKDIIINATHGEINPSILAIFKDKERAKDVLRISLSYKTTTEEVNKFIKEFKSIYKDISLGGE